MRFAYLLVFVLLACSATARADVPWTHHAESGEDATSRFYYFFQSNGDRIERIRTVWNGGAGNPPTVTDYRLDPDRIVVRERLGRRDATPALVAGREADLELKHEDTMLLRAGSVTKNDAVATRHRVVLRELIYLLAMERIVFNAGATNPGQ